MKLKPYEQVLVIVLLVLCYMRYQGTGMHPPLPPFHPPAGSVKALFTYDVNSPPAIVDSSELRAWMKGKDVDFRFAPADAPFSDDQPEFKALMAKPRKSNNWLYVKSGRREDDEALPATDAEAEKFIGRYAR